jgi:hypothetical protein
MEPQENLKEEILTPTPGDCWNPIRLIEYNCEDCKYFIGCTYERKGKIIIKGNGSKKKKRKMG